MPGSEVGGILGNLALDAEELQDQFEAFDFEMEKKLEKTLKSRGSKEFY
jgi:hypothetical protein